MKCLASSCNCTEMFLFLPFQSLIFYPSLPTAELIVLKLLSHAATFKVALAKNFLSLTKCFNDLETYGIQVHASPFSSHLMFHWLQCTYVHLMPLRAFCLVYAVVMWGKKEAAASYHRKCACLCESVNVTKKID